jgi:hypothetical protein
VLVFLYFVGGWKNFGVDLHHLVSELHTICLIEVLTNTTWGTTRSSHTVWLKTLNLALMGGTPQHSLFISLFVYFILFLFLFSFVTLVFCFSGTSVLEFKFGGNALSHTCSNQFLHLLGKIFPCIYTLGTMCNLSLGVWGTHLHTLGLTFHLHTLFPFSFLFCFAFSF